MFVVIVVMVAMIVVMVAMIVIMLVMVVFVMVMVVFVMIVIMLLVVMIVVMVMMLVMRAHAVHVDQGGGMLDRVHDYLAGDVVPRGGDQARVGVLLAHQLDGLFQLFLADQLRAAENDGLRALDLVDEEFGKVLEIHFALSGVHDGGAAGEMDFAVLLFLLLHHAADVGQLAHAAGLDDQAVGMIFFNQLADGLGEIARQRAADAAGVQLGNLNAAVLHEAAVNADLAVFVFEQDALFARKRFLQQFFDQRRFSRAQEAGNDGNFRHKNTLFEPFKMVSYIVARQMRNL